MTKIKDDEWKDKNILFLNGVIESLTVERDLYRQALEKIRYRGWITENLDTRKSLADFAHEALAINDKITEKENDLETKKLENIVD